MSPIEHVWDALDQRMRQCEKRNILDWPFIVVQPRVHGTLVQTSSFQVSSVSVKCFVFF